MGLMSAKALNRYAIAARCDAAVMSLPSESSLALSSLRMQSAHEQRTENHRTSPVRTLLHSAHCSAGGADVALGVSLLTASSFAVEP